MFVSLLAISPTFTPCLLPLHLEGVSAGFPSPAQDFIERALDLSELDKLNQHNGCQVFFAREGLGRSWTMNRQHLSSTYTAKWTDILKVR